MNDLVLDSALAVSIAIGFVILHGVGARMSGGSGKAWKMLLGGVLLLFLGNVLNVIEDLRLLDSFEGTAIPLFKHLVTEYVCFLGGVLLLVFGVIGSLSTAGMRDRITRLEHSLTGASRELQSSKELFSSVMKSSLSGIMILKAVRDADNRVSDFEVRIMNGSAEQIIGRAGSALLGKRLIDQVPCIKKQGLLESGTSVMDTGLPYRGECCVTEGREPSWYEIVAVKLLNDGLAVNFADISLQKRSEEQLRHAAHHDALTGLPNRILFMQRVEQAINRAKRFSSFRFAVMYLDFDRFKIVNDSLGHDAGDQLLINISNRLRENLRAIDTASRASEGHLPARLGGDEFVILLENVKSEEDTLRIAERLQAELSQPHELCGQQCVSTASIGIVFSDERYNRPDEMLRDADTAMYEAKTTGKARHVVFDEHMHKAIIERLELEHELRDAVEKEAFAVQYEPIVRLDTGVIAGFEALLRWPHETRGMIPPSKFIEMAEELQLIVPMGAWILEQACRSLAEWQQQFPEHANLCVNVNLSKQQLGHPQLLPTIERVLAETGIDPTTLRLEVTESMIMDDLKALGPILQSIKDLGPRLVMDDFGTGHSSLSCLHRFPFDVLKIDRSFIRSVKQKREYAAIVNAVVNVAQNLHMDVVAEGIETDDQLTLLRALDCSFGQGHLFSAPIDPEQVAEMLGQNQTFKTAA